MADRVTVGRIEGEDYRAKGTGKTVRARTHTHRQTFERKAVHVAQVPWIPAGFAKAWTVS